MRITFCGTGAASLNAARAGAAIHVEQDGAGLLLDCGPGWLERFLGARLEPERLEAVVVPANAWHRWVWPVLSWP